MNSPSFARIETAAIKRGLMSYLQFASATRANAQPFHPSAAKLPSPG